ncbi:MAG: TspO/MBR family protein [Eubacteriales bacterium]|jgi:benzodiazapine receptor|nr:tryptophan-rich sensory protein [Clostridiales bacterium]
MKKKINWLQLIIVVIITEIVGVLGNILSGNASGVYASFDKPPLSPPGWLFGVIWPILYLLMAISVYIIYETTSSPDGEKVTNLYWLQLFVNFLWPVVFFRFGWYWVAVVVIILLDILVIITMKYFYDIKKTAAYLLIPYLVWILFATYLNIGVAALN